MSTRRSHGIGSHGIAGLLAAAGLVLAGCGGAAEGADTGLPEVAAVQPAPDGGPPLVTLRKAAEQRLGIQTAAVAAGPGGLAVPYAALVYEPDGSTWVFVRIQPSTYRRVAVTVAGKTGDQLTLTAGPPAGTEVVTVGAPELVGTEIGIDGEE